MAAGCFQIVLFSLSHLSAFGPVFESSVLIPYPRLFTVTIFLLPGNIAFWEFPFLSAVPWRYSFPQVSPSSPPGASCMSGAVCTPAHCVLQVEVLEAGCGVSLNAVPSGHCFWDWILQDGTLVSWLLAEPGEHVGGAGECVGRKPV